jgi:fluoride exporter
MTMLLYIATGGLVGTVARYLLQGWVQTRSGTGFPLGTLAVNVAGSLALGFLIRYATGSTVVSPEVRAALTIGFCGAFTTMSTFSYESVALLGDGEYLRASLYMGGTIAGCVLAVVAGTVMAERLL